MTESTKPVSRGEQQRARAYARTQRVPYAEALRAVRRGTDTAAAPDWEPTPAAVASWAAMHHITEAEARAELCEAETKWRTARESDPYSIYTGFDRDGAEAVREWEYRRAGRPIRLWEAVIEVRAAATSEAEATQCLTSAYTQRPLHRIVENHLIVTKLPDWDGQIAHHVTEHTPDAAEAAILAAAYPQAAFDTDAESTANGYYSDRHEIHVRHYTAALRRLADAERAGRTPAPAAPVARIDARLRFWKARWQVEFLATDDVDARSRVQALAATLPAPTAVDGLQPHPRFGTSHEALDVRDAAEGLWADYEAGPGADTGERLAAHLEACAAEVEEQFAAGRAEAAAFEARLHTQPDGTRTLSSVEALDDVRAAARDLARGKNRAELLKMAEEKEYLARRFYGRSVATDGGEMRIERLEATAAVWRAMAEHAPAPEVPARCQSCPNWSATLPCCC
ncbi:hypothetical protein [Glycomyces sp. MUSA5-2]|uniref:hypothetical protein n=1 Tax=Glycomyces sp. MUSA5-2 TaxID=2053002 RepID=UPI0030086974